jgi:DNA repair exonuclease SbcCD ATPase subunit
MQSRERLSQLIQRRNRQQCQQIQKLERDKQQVERERDQAIEEKERELRRLNQQLEQSELLQHVIDLRDATIAKIEQQLRQCREEMTQQIQRQSRQIQQLERDKGQVEQERDQAIEEKERWLGRVNQQLEENERLIADFGKQNTELEEELSVLRSQKLGTDVGAKAGAVSKTDFKLRWREGEKAPCKMVRSCDPVVGNNTVYCKYGVSKVYSYHIPSSNWSPVTNWPTKGFTFTVIGGLLTTVGGYGDGRATNKL